MKITTVKSLQYSTRYMHVEFMIRHERRLVEFWFFNFFRIKLNLKHPLSLHQIWFNERGERNCMFLTPEPNVIKLFTAVIYELL
jgi:hypothetical protein